MFSYCFYYIISYIVRATLVEISASYAFKSTHSGALSTRTVVFLISIPSGVDLVKNLFVNNIFKGSSSSSLCCTKSCAMRSIVRRAPVPPRDLVKTNYPCNASQLIKTLLLNIFWNATFVSLHSNHIRRYISQRANLTFPLTLHMEFSEQDE